MLRAKTSPARGFFCFGSQGWVPSSSLPRSALHFSLKPSLSVGRSENTSTSRQRVFLKTLIKGVLRLLSSTFKNQP